MNHYAEDQQPVYTYGIDHSIINEADQMAQPDVITLVDDTNHHSMAAAQVPFVQQFNQEYNNNNSDGAHFTTVPISPDMRVSTAVPPKSNKSDGCLFKTSIIMALICLGCCCCCIFIPVMIVKMVARGVNNLTRCINPTLNFGDVQHMEVLFPKNSIISLQFTGVGDYVFLKREDGILGVTIDEERKSLSKYGYRKIRTRYSASSANPYHYIFTTNIDNKDKDDCYRSKKKIYIPDGYHLQVDASSGSVKIDNYSPINFQSVNIRTSSGDIILGSVTATNDIILTSSGSRLTVSKVRSNTQIVMHVKYGRLLYDTLTSPSIVMTASSLASISGRYIDLVSNGKLSVSSALGDQSHDTILNSGTIAASTTNGGSITMTLYSGDWSGSFSLTSQKRVEMKVASAIESRVTYTTNSEKAMTGTFTPADPNNRRKVVLSTTQSGITKLDILE